MVLLRFWCFVTSLVSSRVSGALLRFWCFITFMVFYSVIDVLYRFRVLFRRWCFIAPLYSCSRKGSLKELGQIEALCDRFLSQCNVFLFCYCG